MRLALRRSCISRTEGEDADLGVVAWGLSRAPLGVLLLSGEAPAGFCGQCGRQGLSSLDARPLPGVEWALADIRTSPCTGESRDIMPQA